MPGESEAALRERIAELERRLAERTAECEAAGKELETFAYSVSHDLRAPLRAIDGYTRILLEDFGPRLDAEGQRVCGVIRESAGLMGRLIESLVSYSRAGRATLQPEAVDMAALANEAFLEVPTPGGRGRIDLRVGALPPARCDRTLLRTVWVNLLSNAVKFSAKRERSVVEVDGGLQVDEVVYSVRDNGAGFDMEYAGKLFGVFQRLHSAREFEGGGIGLAIAQRILRRHGGRIWASSRPDQGATLSFALPAGETTNGGSAHGS